MVDFPMNQNFSSYNPSIPQQQVPSRSQARYVLYYSNLCEHCMELMILLKKNPSLGEGVQKNCVDNNPKVPSFLKSVPTLYIQESESSKPYLYVGENVFKWFQKRGKQQQSGPGVPPTHPSAQSAPGIGMGAQAPNTNKTSAEKNAFGYDTFNSQSLSPFGGGFGTTLGDLMSDEGMMLGISQRTMEQFQSKLDKMPSPSGEMKYESFSVPSGPGPQQGGGGGGMNSFQNGPPPPMMTNHGGNSGGSGSGGMSFDEMMEKRKREFS